MNKQSFLKIVLTGPESSGKTTLATQLAAALNAPWVPEFARFYLGSLGRPYERTDLPRILSGQMAWENWYLQKSEHFLVCDTDWTVVYIWEQYRFIPDHPLIQIPPLSTLPVLYLLCAPDFPWQPDPLREHPEERSILFDRYQQLLNAQNLPFMVLSGSPEKRFAQAWQYIQDVYRP
jgi:hypothetical protein